MSKVFTCLWGRLFSQAEEKILSKILSKIKKIPLSLNINFHITVGDIFWKPTTRYKTLIKKKTQKATLLLERELVSPQTCLILLYWYEYILFHTYLLLLILNKKCRESNLTSDFWALTQNFRNLSWHLRDKSLREQPTRSEFLKILVFIQLLEKKQCFKNTWHKDDTDGASHQTFSNKNF